MNANAFVQHLAVRLVANGYFFYVLGEIPSHKEPQGVDAKFVERYGIADSKWAQFRRKERGEAKVRYLRFQRTFILIATVGSHLFHVEEKVVIQDVRNAPIDCFGYRIRCWRDAEGRFHPSVDLSAACFAAFAAKMTRLASHRSAEELDAEIQSERFLWFSGVKRQVFKVLSLVNQARKEASLETVFIPKETFMNRSRPVFSVNK